MPTRIGPTRIGPIRIGQVAMGSAVALAVFVPVAASAQEVDTYGGGGTVVTVPKTDATPIGDPGDPPDGSLPFTGGDAAGLAAIGAVAVAAGVVATRARRRRTLA